MDTLSTALDHIPGPGTDVIARVTEFVDVDDVASVAADVADTAVDGIGAAADASRSLASAVRRHPVLAVLAVGAAIGVLIAWRFRAQSDEPAQLEIGDAA